MILEPARPTFQVQTVQVVSREGSVTGPEKCLPSELQVSEADRWAALTPLIHVELRRCSNDPLTSHPGEVQNHGRESDYAD